jgi:hypothetical protein
MVFVALSNSLSRTIYLTLTWNRRIGGGNVETASLAGVAAVQGRSRGPTQRSPGCLLGML